MKFENYSIRDARPVAGIIGSNAKRRSWNSIRKPEVLVISSYPPRECGIATYTQDLIASLRKKFDQSFDIRICALESEQSHFHYSEDVQFVLNTDSSKGYNQLVNEINSSDTICAVLIQHEFGLYANTSDEFHYFLEAVQKPVALVFHTVLPNPGSDMKQQVIRISDSCDSIIVMTRTSKEILIKDYGVLEDKISVIPHGTHLVGQGNSVALKQKYGLEGRRVLSTFGLLSSGKGVETTLDALPGICQQHPDVLFLIIGKTHPSVLRKDGEKYRKLLEEKVAELHLQDHVRFINEFLALPVLLEYLQLTDIYLFTSKDPNQAVSGTFAYAVSCGCPIVSTPIPHAKEVLKTAGGLIFDFGDSAKLGEFVHLLLGDEKLRSEIRSGSLHGIAATAWENSAIAHASLIHALDPERLEIKYSLPEIKLQYLQQMTTDFGLIQFASFNQPDLNSGYTLDDNARALIAMCMHFESSGNCADLHYIKIYLDFIAYCYKVEGYFLNYVNENYRFTEQNHRENLEDANGRAIWALGYLISNADILPPYMVDMATEIMNKVLPGVYRIHSTRAMAFIVKGLYHRGLHERRQMDVDMLTELSDRMVRMFRHESDENWFWFEGIFTYANSLLPEALMCAWQATGKKLYREVAVVSFDFLLSIIYSDGQLRVVPNNQWMQRGQTARLNGGAEQPIDVAYTVLALSRFYNVLGDDMYKEKLYAAFHWFSGNNRLKQIMYNPFTGGCYDGLEENNVNLNQGAESLVSYLMARFTIEQHDLESRFIKEKRSAMAIS